MSAERTPWAVGPHPWPEQIGCCPLVGRPYSVHNTDMHNVAAAVSEDIARLIAAAPDLLEALQEANTLLQSIPALKNNQRVTDAVQANRAAIAKATEGKP
jgi:hypothetical protein